MSNSSKSTNILVTGCHGQVGSEIKVLSTEYKHTSYTFSDKDELDITNHAEVLSYFSSHRFDYVINCAAYTNVDKAEEDKELCEAVNVKGTENLAIACAQHSAMLIHISSDYVYNPQHSMCSSESSACRPEGIYAKTKYEAELMVKKHLEDFLIIRSSWIYSSFGHNFVKTMIRLGKTKSELSIVDDQIGSPTYAYDLAKAILIIIEQVNSSSDPRAFSGTYNFSNLGLVSWADFAEEVFNNQNIDLKINRIPSSEYPTAAPRPLNSRLSKSKITDTFQLELRHWKKSLRKCLKEIDN